MHKQAPNSPVFVEAEKLFEQMREFSHDQYTRSKPGLGPVASRVVTATPGAVLVGRELSDTSKQWRILAAIDGSFAAEEALDFVRGVNPHG